MSRGPQYQPGQIVPGTVYRVHRVIGAGGMGTVYDVEDTTVGKRYVLKTLHANLADREDLAGRLLREARALARMHHPSIVEVFTAGTTNDQLKLPYFVMERLNGQSLRQVLNRRQRIELDQAVDIGIDLLDALDHAHELGMVHRDVKPDNIFLHKGIDGMPVAKLLDFGIAKVVASSTQLTGGRFIGTFRYASPEQILGKEVTPKSDLYAAGLTIFEMIAGRGPFDDFVGEVEIGKAHASVHPPRLSQFVPNTPRVLDDLIASSLDKRPENRPKDAYTFASVLRDIKRAARGAAAAPVSAQSQQDTAKPVATSAPTAVGAPQPSSSPTAVAPAPIDETRQPITPQMYGAPAEQPTRLESPQARSAETAAAEPAPSSLTNPYGPQLMDTRVSPQHTMRLGAAHTLQDGAPAPMTMLPALSPQPPAVDRSAETRASEPYAPPAPQGDTQRLAVVPHTGPEAAAVLAQQPQARPPSVPPPAEGVSTFAAQTTDAPAPRGSGAKAAVIFAVAFVAVAAVGLGALYLRRDKGPSTAATTPDTTTAPAPTPTLPAPTQTLEPALSSAPLAPTTSATTTSTATNAPPAATTATPAATTATTPTPTTKPGVKTDPKTDAKTDAKPTATARSSAPATTGTKRDPLRVGSGLD